MSLTCAVSQAQTTNVTLCRHLHGSILQKSSSASVLPIWLSSQSEIRKWQFCFFEEYFMLHSTVVAGEAEEVTHDAGDVVVEGAGGGQEKQ